MAKSDGIERQRQQGSSGQRREGQRGGHEQAELPGDHGGQQGGKQQQLGESPRRDDGAEQAPGSRATQGNLGTTQREWSNRDNLADTDEA